MDFFPSVSAAQYLTKTNEQILKKEKCTCSLNSSNQPLLKGRQRLAGQGPGPNTQPPAPSPGEEEEEEEEDPIVSALDSEFPGSLEGVRSPLHGGRVSGGRFSDSTG